MARSMHQQAVHSFLHHFGEFRDGMFSMFSAAANAKGVPQPDYDPEATMVRGTLALKKFSDYPKPSSTDEYIPWSSLGLSVLSYVHCALGSSAAPVRRRLLSYLAELPVHGYVLRSHPVVVTHVMLDIYDCLLY
jgi:hypothetical protein